MNDQQAIDRLSAWLRFELSGVERKLLDQRIIDERELKAEFGDNAQPGAVMRKIRSRIDAAGRAVAKDLAVIAAELSATEDELKAALALFGEWFRGQGQPILSQVRISGQRWAAHDASKGITVKRPPYEGPDHELIESNNLFRDEHQRTERFIAEAEALVRAACCPRTQLVVHSGRDSDIKPAANNEAPAPKASREEVRAWVAQQVEARKTQSYCGTHFRKAVPGKVVVAQNRDTIRDMWNEEMMLRGQAPRPGPRPKT